MKARSTWGSKRKRGENSWELRYPVNGKAKRETFHGTAREADRRLAELRIQYEGVTDDMTLEQFWDSYYLSDIENRLAQTTVEGYIYFWNSGIKETFGDKPLNAITPRMVQDWLSTMTKGKAQHLKRALSAILSRAFALGLVDDNVADRRFTIPKEYSESRRTKDIYTFEQLNEIFHACEGELWEAAFILAAFGGAIRSEACSPKLCEVEFVNSDGETFAVIPIQRGIHRINGETVIQDHAKNEYRETAIIIPPPYSLRLKTLVHEGIARGDTWLTDDGFGNPHNPEFISKRFERWFQRNPFAYIPFSNLRNAYSTYLHNTFSVDAAQVSKLMRHKKLDTDYEHYNRPSVQDKINALKAMGNYGQNGKNEGIYGQ